jgi:hypothetical protein
MQMNILRSKFVAALVVVPALALLLAHAIMHPWDPEIILGEFVHKKPPTPNLSEMHTPSYSQKDVKIPLGPSTYQRFLSLVNQLPRAAENQDTILSEEAVLMRIQA